MQPVRLPDGVRSCRTEGGHSPRLVLKRTTCPGTRSRQTWDWGERRLPRRRRTSSREGHRGAAATRTAARPSCDRPSGRDPAPTRLRRHVRRAVHLPRPRGQLPHVYEVHDQVLLIQVVSVGHRRDVYRLRNTVGRNDRIVPLAGRLRSPSLAAVHTRAAGGVCAIRTRYRPRLTPTSIRHAV